MVRKGSITVVAVAMTAVLLGCGANGNYASGGDELTVASSNPGIRLGAGNQLGENIFRHYVEVTRNRRERLAEAQSRANESVADATSDNTHDWFVVLPHRRMFIYPGVMVLQPVDGHTRDVKTVHQLLPS